MNESSDINQFVPVSVVISTRNRGDSIVATIKSILANKYPLFELIIVDQSDNDLTEKAVQPFIKEAIVHYQRSNLRGVSIGRNTGISSSLNEIIAITDDDCEVPSDWLMGIVAAFKFDPKIGLVFGNVHAGIYDVNAGFIPTYVRQEPFLARHINQKNQVRGIGACMALKRSVWKIVHGFDPQLGPGGKLRSAEDFDYAIKTLMVGYYIFETPLIKVTHLGFRTWKEGRSLAYRNWIGIGAMVAKYSKRRNRFVLSMIVSEWGNYALMPMIRNFVVKGKLSGVTPPVAFWIGFIKGLATPLDPMTGNYC